MRRVGEIQCIGFYGSFPEEAYLPAGKSCCQPVALMQICCLSPTPGRLLLPQYVDSEKENCWSASAPHQRQTQLFLAAALRRCAARGLRRSPPGAARGGENINYKKLTRHYRELLQDLHGGVFYCGKRDKQGCRRLPGGFGLPARGEMTMGPGH